MCGQGGWLRSRSSYNETLFTQPNTKAILLVDATNAFNCLNRSVALQNILCICPSIAPALVNCYRNDLHLFVGGEVVSSSKSTTQGAPSLLECLLQSHLSIS